MCFEKSPTIQYNAMQCNAMQRNATQYLDTIRYNTMRCDAMRLDAMRHDNTRYGTGCDKMQYLLNTPQGTNTVLVMNVQLTILYVKDRSNLTTLH